MPGRHSAAPTTASGSTGLVKYGVIAVVLLLVVGGGVYAAQKAFGSGCKNPQTFSLAADPAIADVVEQIVADTPAEDLGCANVDVTATESGNASAAVSMGVDVPSLWIPDSALWVGKAVRATGSLVDVASQSVASSPVLIAARKDEVPFFDSWLTALQLKGLRIGNPLTNTVSDAAILGALAEAGTDADAVDSVSAALVPIAQAQAETRGEADPVVRLEETAADGGVSVVSEQTLVDFQDSTGTEFGVTAPPTGSFFLNFPLAVTEPEGAGREAAKTAGLAVADALASESGLQALSEAG
ncbi:MAG: hypothetical protein WBA81_15475, partial [Rhodococcus sp. (in: high G+C Gram-positive bacteria)]